MADPDVAVVRVPVPDSAGVNQGAAFTVIRNPFVDATTGTWDTFSAGGTVEDPTAAEGWTDYAFLESADGTQAEMASATGEFVANVVTFLGLDLDVVAGAAVQDRFIRTVDLVFRAAAAYPLPANRGRRSFGSRST